MERLRLSNPLKISIEWESQPNFETEAAISDPLNSLAPLAEKTRSTTDEALAALRGPQSFDEAIQISPRLRVMEEEGCGYAQGL